MRNYLRESIEKMKQYYIHKLEEASVYKVSDYDLSSLTLSELEYIYKEYYPHQKKQSPAADHK